MDPVTLKQVGIENLRGYFSTSLNLNRKNTIIVGPNNAGKTSLLRLLNWAFNEIDDGLLKGKRPPTDEEIAMLLPARDTRNRARRLTLHINVPDGRSWTKFKCNKDGIALLRLNLRLTPQKVVYVALDQPQRGEKAQSEPEAIEMFERLRSSTEFVHIPSFRDAKSDSFDTTFGSAIKSRIEEKALHHSQGGAPKEYRDVSEGLKSLKNVVEGLASPLWDEVKKKLPPGLAQTGKLELDCDQAELLRFLESRLSLSVSTGDHDAKTVPLIELGSGLQSLLDLAFQESDVNPAKQVIIAVEEPEAFLHPSAQRTVASRLLGSSENHKAIVTTHSPVVVEEAKYGDIVICREQKFYEPKSAGEQKREEVNTALLSGYGAEMVFASSVLFVEGEGDRQFFEQLRRRLARHDTAGSLDRCFVVPVGGNTRFGPWMLLLDAYGSSDDRPIQWLAVCDADAATEIRQGFKDAGITVKQEVLDAIGNVTSAKNKVTNAENKNKVDIQAWRSATEKVNKEAKAAKSQLYMMNLDLEEAALADAKPKFLASLAAKAGWDAALSKEEIMRRLGAKAHGGGDGAEKGPWLRGYIGENIPPKEVSESVKHCLDLWFTPVLSSKEIKKLFSAWNGK